ncbi:MAG: hypothetical protein P8Y13_06245 [Deinococcales bacterium]
MTSPTIGRAPWQERLLAYLGVAGAASRARLAGLLWENGTGRANLRMEIHRLSEAVGHAMFEAGADPLRLPPYVEVEQGDDATGFLEGMEGLSYELDRWIDEIRRRAERAGVRNLRSEATAIALARDLRMPFLILLRAAPAEQPDDFLTALGEALRLPVVEGTHGAAQAVHVLVPPYPQEDIEAVLRAREGAWVLRLPAYGEDPEGVLELRNAIDPARVRYVELPRVSWREARGGPLRDLPFGDAAEAFLWTGGNAGFLRELSRIGWARDDDGELAVPQRVRAAYLLEARHMSPDARFALERLSVHPGPITETLIDALEVRDALEELEQRGWLVYRGGWHFRDAEARTVLYRSVQPGRRAAYHRTVAAHMAADGSWLLETYHLLKGGQPVVWSDAEAAREGLAGDAARAWWGLEVEGVAPRHVQARVGRELALLETARYGDGVEGEGADWQFVTGPGRDAAEVDFELPEKRCLLHVRGQAWSHPPFERGGTGTWTPLYIEVADARRLVLLKGLTRPVAREEGLIVPLSDNLDLWIALPASTGMRVGCEASGAILELELTIHELASSGTVTGTAHSEAPTVSAIVLPRDGTAASPVHGIQERRRST